MAIASDFKNHGSGGIPRIRFSGNNFTKNEDNIKSLYPGEVSKKPFAHYETESHYITILILNDIAKRSSLYAYYTLPYQDKPVKVICLESQKKLFTVQFPQAEIILVDL